MVSPRAPPPQWRHRKKTETFARDAVAEGLLVVERETLIAVASCSVAATDTFVRARRIAADTVDVVAGAGTFGHHFQTAHSVVLLQIYNSVHSGITK